MFLGFDSLIAREIPFDTIQALVYEYLKFIVWPYALLESHLVHGAIAGAIAAFLTTPIDVAKTRLMTQYGEAKIIYNEVW